LLSVVINRRKKKIKTEINLHNKIKSIYFASMRKKHRSKFHLLVRGMIFSDKVSKGEIKPSVMDCLGWGRINAINAGLNSKR